MKQNLFKTLLLAATLLVGGANYAWATAVPYNVGTSTSDAWGTGFSDVWTMTGDGAVTVTFTNHCATDGNWWDNWQLLCGNSSYLPGSLDNANRYFQMRSDRWDDAAGSNAGFIMSDDYFTDFKTFQNEATVTLNIVRSGTTVTVNVAVTKSATTRKMTFVKTGLVGTLNFFLVQSLSYMEITQQSQTTEMAGTVTCNALMNFDGATISSKTVNGGLGTMSWSNQWTATPSIDSDMLRVGNMNDGTVALVGQPGSKDIVTISFDLGLVQLSGGKVVEFKVTDKNGLVLIDEEVNMYDGQFTDGKNTLGFATSDFVSAKTDNPGMSNNTKNKFTLTFNYVERKISCSVINKNGTVNKEIDMPVTADALASFAVRGNYGTASRRCYFDNLLIQTEKGDYNTTKTITYSYQDDNGNDITDFMTSHGAQSSGSGDLGDSFTPTYPSSVTDDDYEYDYTYSSGGEPFTIADNETITLVYTKSAHPTTNVTVQYKSGGMTVKEEVVAVNYPVGKSISYGVHQYLIGNDGMFYQTAQGNPNWYYRSAAAAASLTENVTLSGINNVVFFTEAEDISGYTAYSNNSNRASNGDIAYSGGEYRNLTTLAPGKYRVYTRSIRGNDNTHALNIKCGESVVGEFNVEKGTNEWKNTEEFTVSTTSVLSVASGGSSKSGLDFIYVVKTGQAVTIGTSGWATLYTPYALDFEGTGVTAYTATCDGSTVTLTEVTTVPANTGVVLTVTGEPDTYNIPVIASSSTAKGQLEGNANAATAYDAVTGKDLYMLAINASNKVQFTKVTSGSIAAGKAYLPVTKSEVKAFAVEFADANAISDVRSKMEDGRNEIFNLAGQRMSKLQRGVNIVNGKKILVK